LLLGISQRIQQWLGVKPKASPRTDRLRPRTVVTWVIPGKLAVGGSPRPGDSVALAQAGIKVIFSLCAECEEVLPEDVTQSFHCLRLVLPDSHYKSEIKSSQLTAAIDIVQHSIDNQLPIYVHCLAGIERSPTVCIAYLCQSQHLELWEALNWLKQCHPPSMPTESQLRVVRQYIKEQRSRSSASEISTS